MAMFADVGLLSWPGRSPGTYVKKACLLPSIARGDMGSEQDSGHRNAAWDGQ